MTTFKDIIPDERLLLAIQKLGFTEPTEIQVKTIPPGLTGKDLIGQAKTGSGKTLAFGVPLIHRLTQGRDPEALIIAPTRELCRQIAQELRTLSRETRIAAVFGGVSINPQITELKSAQIVVGTPGRLLDHLERGTFRTRGIRFLVFDEADRMFDMGFVKEMERIVSRLPAERQTMLFSATMPEAIKRLASKHQRDPVHVRAGSHVEEHLLPQFCYKVPRADKFSFLVHLLKQEDPFLAFIFTRTKHGARALARNLCKQGFEAVAMHGNLSQSQRDAVIKDLKAGKIRILVATDVAARGLDVKHVSHVINDNVPTVPEDYIHRIGRTARAGAKGKAITLIEPGEAELWRAILRLPKVTPTELRAEGYLRLVYEKRTPRGDGRRGGRPASRGAPHGARPRGLQRTPRPPHRRAEANRLRRDVRVTAKTDPRQAARRENRPASHRENGASIGEAAQGRAPVHRRRQVMRLFAAALIASV